MTEYCQSWWSQRQPRHAVEPVAWIVAAFAALEVVAAGAADYRRLDSAAGDT